MAKRMKSRFQDAQCDNIEKIQILKLRENEC